MRAIRCRSCGEVQPPAFFCRSCEAIQALPQDTDYFTVLDLPAHPGVDVAALDRRYYELSRKLHPDRYQTRSADEQRASVQATALLNAAHKTLRDTEARGRYWLTRSGDGLGHETQSVPPRLAAYVFDVQEKLDELRSSVNGSKATLRSELVETQRELTERLERQRAALVDLLRGWPADPDAGSALVPDERIPAALRELKSALSELSYLRTLDRDLQNALEA
ncbi:DnaJ domain-containing protein [Candidatus Binatia bacterium]|nr:DnaJ domain-containing protein [Candidatus Binatia bacterium]